MILQVAILNVRTGAEEEFETAFPQASSIISATPGYVSHQLQHCFFAKNASCAFEMATRPQTLYGLADSPVSLAAWEEPLLFVSEMRAAFKSLHQLGLSGDGAHVVRRPFPPPTPTRRTAQPMSVTNAPCERLFTKRAH